MRRIPDLEDNVNRNCLLLIKNYYNEKKIHLQGLKNASKDNMEIFRKFYVLHGNSLSSN